MPLQYLADYDGKRTAVVIPIKEWEKLVKKHSDLEALDLPAAEGRRVPLMKEFAGTLSKEQGDALLKYVEQAASH
ncbi:MAG: hypothetical protein ABS46_03210 [Cytophagaceae bacterium SCN 52-12]|nr:MAG: hypothetical protein ABS46_03210 [Cytophagaceae bacterium SCN 52-12]